MAPIPSKSLKINLDKEWQAESLTPKALDILYKNQRKQNDEMKDELKEFMRRLVKEVNPNVVSNILLEDEPLIQMYDFFLEASKEVEVSLVVISDSSASHA
ncbi:hypothetical protein C2S52_001671 [Perilla frutescens var. hirtella]|nr:hypothetical protein C2S51_006883 [Perilla frutescens var. frutescens]KAH6801207.1 hypothetical protein C2S52_001671 [Perilla frutescens var. hirtella]